MWMFDPAEGKDRIVRSIDDPVRAAAVAQELDDQIAIFRSKAEEVKESRSELIEILARPDGTKAEFLAELDEMNSEMGEFDKRLIEERTAMKKHMTAEEWSKAFGDLGKQE